MNPSIAGRDICVQAVLYNNEIESIRRTVVYLDRAVEHAKNAGFIGEAILALGDCSTKPSLTSQDIEALTAHAKNLTISYEFFNQNLGYGGGNNRLMVKSQSHYILIYNPDVMADPMLLKVMLKKFQETNIGLVEARQLPIEHPKYYDPVTGDTGWGSGACALVERKTFETIGAFDHETFFMYGDDVDISWRMRLAGKRVVMEPRALAYHDKKLRNDARWDPSPAEVRYSAECALFLAYKYSRDDLVETILKQFKAIPKQPYIDVCLEFETRQREGRMPPRLDPDNQVAEFVDGNYTKHRC